MAWNTNVEQATEFKTKLRTFYFIETRKYTLIRFKKITTRNCQTEDEMIVKQNS